MIEKLERRMSTQHESAGNKVPPTAETAADKRAENKRKLRAALKAALAVPENQRVLIELSKR
jgi:hypothetical protein